MSSLFYILSRQEPVLEPTGDGRWSSHGLRGTGVGDLDLGRARM